MKTEETDYIVNKIGAKILLKSTASYTVFVEESGNLEMMLLFILFAEHNDRDNLKKSLSEYYEEDQNVVSEKLVDFLKSEDSNRIFNAENYELYFGQMAYCRLVDNSLCYFKDILSEVVKKQPKVLKSSKEEETHEFILSFETIDELRRSLSDKKIKELFYGSIEDIKKFFLDRLGIKLFDNDADEKNFSMVIKQRNLIVHNRGIVTQELAEEFFIYKDNVGQNISFGYEQLSNINKIINNLIIEIDIKLREKFKLETISIE